MKSERAVDALAVWISQRRVRVGTSPTINQATLGMHICTAGVAEP